MTGKEIRNSFLSFFEKKGHKALESSPLVPHGDPTLLFTNAGMVQFKGVFLGDEERPCGRAVTVQKCLRAGGKHNDLENVGKTARHHTFFEMLGNFSFGDYFKEEAIELAWEYLTGVLGLPGERLIITIFNDDDEAGKIWEEKAGLSPEKIVRCGEKDNFWSMGDTGPCGPCSEIHYDQGEAVGCGRPECNVECDCDRYLEVWNLVFMQYNRDEKGQLTPLPHPSIDTGMGLERLAAVVQGKSSNFDSDLFAGIFRHIEELSERKYGDNEKDDISMRVIADHMRAITFLITDGVLPSNEGRGYVLRRIMRRAARHGRKLGLKEPFLHLTAGAVADEMGETYPALKETRDYCARVIVHEEERFLNTLDHGMRLLEEEVEKLKDEGAHMLNGEVAFKLYDTYGFPLDLTEDVLKESEMTVDRDGFERSMDKQKDAARQAWAGSGEDKVSAVYAELVKKGINETDFAGYDAAECEGKVLAIIKEGKIADSAGEGDSLEIVTDRTVFYGESGGQKGDAGEVFTSSGSVMTVSDTWKPLASLVVHKGTVKRGRFHKEDRVQLKIDAEKRSATEKNHSATHLLHSALKEVLGDHVNQAGSLVAGDRLRFDFSHFTSLSRRELAKIEEIVNEQIWFNSPLSTELLSIAEAKAKGATALFGEKYGDTVRVVTVPGFSMELCGGTHVNMSGEIGPFRIISEGGIAAGVRRIEAATGQRAYEISLREREELDHVGALVRGKGGEIGKKVEALIAKQKGLENEINKLKEKLASSGGKDMMADVIEVNGTKVLSIRIEGADAKSLRSLMDNLKNKIGSGVVVIGAPDADKVLLIAGVTSDLTSRFHAGKIAGQIAPLVGGKGGGRPDMAQAGGKDVSKLDDALAKVKEIVANTV
ncbi:MAG: alanine--tRNA ligase [Deltaproteobacteria bacterium]|nr:alanine--tRNA ligase [Deltaproteobacteria bacterium]